MWGQNPKAQCSLAPACSDHFWAVLRCLSPPPLSLFTQKCAFVLWYVFVWGPNISDHLLLHDWGTGRELKKRWRSGQGSPGAGGRTPFCFWSLGRLDERGVAAKPPPEDEKEMRCPRRWSGVGGGLPGRPWLPVGRHMCVVAVLFYITNCLRSARWQTAKSRARARGLAGRGGRVARVREGARRRPSSSHLGAPHVPRFYDGVSAIQRKT